MRIPTLTTGGALVTTAGDVPIGAETTIISNFLCNIFMYPAFKLLVPHNKLIYISVASEKSFHAHNVFESID